MSTKPLNILWVSFEDTNPFYGCYGDKVGRTPTLDRLAAEGCRWPNAFSTCGVCAPARSAVITGMYPPSIGTHHMRTTHTHDACPEMPTPYSAVLPHYVRCFTEYLRAAGYYCTNNSKTDYQFDPPITAWDELGNTAHWRNRPQPDQPFFAVFNPTRTHESAMWNTADEELAFDPDDMELPPYFPDTPKVRTAMAHMHTQIEKSDRQLDELLTQLEEDGLADNTVVFHWSDHGPLPRGKRWPYDSGIHVPMIVRWPGELEPGTVSDRLVSTLDLAATVLSIVGLDVPGYMQGQAFLGPQTTRPREYIHAHRDRHDEHYDMVRAVRDARFKYMRHFYPNEPYLGWIPYRNRHPILQEMWRLHMADELTGPQTLMFQHPRPAEELYDTVADPWETHNLAADPAHENDRARLSAELDRWMDDIRDMGRIPETEMVRAWYPDGKRPTTAAPVLIPICEESPGIQPTSQGGTFEAPALLQLHCATQGASIAYTVESGDDPHWLLYAQPIQLAPGTTTIRAKAIRIGYHESHPTTATFKIAG